jgi:hypothetical protein
MKKIMLSICLAIIPSMAHADAIKGYAGTGVDTSRIQPGTLPSGVLIPAGSLTAGPTSSSILPSSVAYNSKDNNWSAAQTSQSSWTILSDSFAVGVSTFVIKAGRLGFGTSNPAYPFDIYADGNPTMVIGADLNSMNRTNVTRKFSSVASAHYTNSEEPMALFYGDSQSNSVGVLSIGGGTYGMNAATKISFYTAANATTVSGTERMIITSTGDVQVVGRLDVANTDTDAQFEVKSTVGESQYVAIVSSQNNTIMLGVSGNGQVSANKIILSKEGGYLIRMTNNSGATVTTGTVVNSTSSSLDYGFKINPAGGAQAFGTVYGPSDNSNATGSCADGTECFICVSGICPIYTNGACTRGYWMGTSDTISGMAECVVEPASTSKHDQEVGHNIVAPSAAISWAVVHFR